MPRIADAGTMAVVGGFVERLVDDRTTRLIFVKCDYEIYGYETLDDNEQPVFCPVVVYASLKPRGIARPDPNSIVPHNFFKVPVIQQVMEYLKGETSPWIEGEGPPRWCLYKDHVPKVYFSQMPEYSSRSYTHTLRPTKQDHLVKNKAQGILEAPNFDTSKPAIEVLSEYIAWLASETGVSEVGRNVYVQDHSPHHTSRTGESHTQRQDASPSSQANSRSRARPPVNTTRDTSTTARAATLASSATRSNQPYSSSSSSAGPSNARSISQNKDGEYGSEDWMPKGAFLNKQKKKPGSQGPPKVSTPPTQSANKNVKVKKPTSNPSELPNASRLDLEVGNSSTSEAKGEHTSTEHNGKMPYKNPTAESGSDSERSG